MKVIGFEIGNHSRSHEWKHILLSTCCTYTNDDEQKNGLQWSVKM